MSIDEKAKEFVTQLDTLNTIIPIDRMLFLMYYQSFKDLEDSRPIQDWLVNHREISIEQIKNTKLIFHRIIYQYIVKLANKQMTVPENLDEEALRIFENSITDTLVELALIEEQVLKLPTVESRRANPNDKDTPTNSV